MPVITLRDLRTFKIWKPFDGHVHFRNDNAIFPAVVPLTAAQCWGALSMMNFEELLNADQSRAYKERIRLAANNAAFIPYLAAYLTDDTDPNELRRAFEDGTYLAAKLYPVGATTNSQKGVTSIGKIARVLEMMEKGGWPLCVHAETVRRNGTLLDPYEREPFCIEYEIPVLRRQFPGLKISIEHLSTREGAHFIKAEGGHLLHATLTAHHLWSSRTEVFEGGMSTDFHCLPMIQSAPHRDALRKLAVSGNPNVSMGTDSAPHFASRKRTHRAPGGILTAHAAIELYAQVFEEEGAAVDAFERFTSVNGPRFYGLKPDREMLTVFRRDPWTVDSLIVMANGEYLRPFLYEQHPGKGELISWRSAPS